MCVYKNHAFIYFLRPPPWYGTTLVPTVLLNIRTFVPSGRMGRLAACLTLQAVTPRIFVLPGDMNPFFYSWRRGSWPRWSCSLLYDSIGFCTAGRIFLYLSVVSLKHNRIFLMHHRSIQVVPVATVLFKLRALF